MNRGTFTHAAADNWNRATDAVTGEHLYIVNLILFQSKNRTLERGFDNQENYLRPSLSKDRKRSSTSERLTTQILNFFKGNNVGPVHLKNRLILEWYFQEPQSHTVMRAIDRAWIFLRICPKKIFQIQVTDEIPDDAPQLDGLHLILSFQIVQVFLLILATARPFLLPLQTSIQFTQFFKEQKHCLEGLGRK